MALIDWKPEFAVGIDDVDYEHQELIVMINALHEKLQGGAPTRERISEVLGEIHAGIAAHFALEEMIMQQAHYDRYVEHRADHDKLLEDIGDIMERVDADAYADYEAALSEHLRDWFTVHFRTHDARLHSFFSA